MYQDLYQSQQFPPEQVQYWEIAKSQDQQNFVDNLERQLLDLQQKKNEQENQAMKTIEVYQKIIEEKNHLLDQYQAEKLLIKSRQINVSNHVENINNLSLEVKRLKSELRHKNNKIFELEKKITQLEDDYQFDVKRLNSKQNYQRAITYKLMQSQVVQENNSLKLKNQSLEKEISELNRKLLLIENKQKVDQQSLRNLTINAAARKEQDKMNYEDRIRIEKILKGLDEKEEDNVQIVEVFKDEMLLQGVVEIFTRMRKMIVRNLYKQFVKSNRISQKGELFKELILHYYPDYGKIMFVKQQLHDQQEEENKDQSTSKVNDKIHENIQIIQERDEINSWLQINLVSLKQKRQQEKYNLMRDEQLNLKNESDKVLFQSRQLFQHLALYLKLQHINQTKTNQQEKTNQEECLNIDEQQTKFDIDQDLEINLEEQIVIQYYRLLQIVIKI